MSVFRIATKQAILDMIVESGENKTFGLFVAHHQVDALADRIVDLFEMTLELRQKVQNATSEPNPPKADPRRQAGARQEGATPSRHFLRDEEPVVPRTRRAQELYQGETAIAPLQSQQMPSLGVGQNTMGVGLPKRRVAFTSQELNQRR